jgi:hypothetical protein
MLSLFETVVILKYTTKDRVRGIPLKTGGELRCSVRVSNKSKDLKPIR